MVRTKQGTHTNLPLVQGGDDNIQFRSDPDWDLLMTDNATYVPVASAHSERGESASCQKDSGSQQAEVSLHGVSKR
jgi:hypothetical protein